MLHQIKWNNYTATTSDKRNADGISVVVDSIHERNGSIILFGASLNKFHTG